MHLDLSVLVCSYCTQHSVLTATAHTFYAVSAHTTVDNTTQHNRPFSSYYAQEYNGFVPSTADKWVYMFGIAAIPPLLLNYFLTLLPAARTSSLLSIIGMSYEESMHFHKLTGFAAAFWAVVHGVFCQAPTANVPNGAKVSNGAVCTYIHHHYYCYCYCYCCCC
jgi:hypothetical protein